MKLQFKTFVLSVSCLLACATFSVDKGTITDGDREGITAIIAEIFGLETEIVGIKDISGNNATSKVYKITLNNGKIYILKKNPEWQGVANAIFASKNGFGPRVITDAFKAGLNPYDDSGFSYIITEFIQPLNKYRGLDLEAKKEQFWQKLGESIKIMHACEKPTSIQKRTIFAWLDYHLEKIDKRGNVSESGREFHRRMREFLEKAKSALKSKEIATVVAHNDLSKGNILYSDGNFRFIDFDDMGLGDGNNDLFWSMYEIIFHFFWDDEELSAEMIQQFEDALLQGYFGTDAVITEEQKKAMNLIKKVVLLRWVITQEYFEYTPSEEKKFVYAPDGETYSMKRAFHIAEMVLNEDNIEADVDYGRFEEIRRLANQKPDLADEIGHLIST